MNVFKENEEVAMKFVGLLNIRDNEQKLTEAILKTVTSSHYTIQENFIQSLKNVISEYENTNDKFGL